ncbi:Ribosomal protein L7/L12 C-terminal domain-containing protein [Amycolatopsis xylanica]|uniref:Ribosomal protein L7/L12 C-terminal domain-containing protein n=1 Tax=Amycolatopsis xylanica TaxID=589385 RepID=A0A1H3H4M9_9PSEU|nr:ribosomal protein L7/L12 [Amycolatopsis xylanica]SDY10472.1 Ribosomal protein L7/L12 C-terminal domain-containing protein [Amycolatopsis xylanica]
MDYGTLSLALVVLVAVGWVGSAGIQRQVARVERRLDRTERKLDLVLAHLGITEPEAEMPEVHAYLLKGQKIQAIKAYRERTGAGLKEAKEAVERLG